MAQFTREDIEAIFALAERMHKRRERRETINILRGYMMACLFYEPSTRTYASFHAAMQWLGGMCVPIVGVQYSSVTKGESLPDTVRTLECLSDVIVLRHSETGAAERAAEFLHKPLINAGDGIGEHPTQALLDLFTLFKECGHIDGLTIALVGDLKHGRTIHSLAKLLTLYRVRVIFVSPPALALERAMAQDLVERGLSFQETDDLVATLPMVDALYVTRVQKERFTSPTEYEVLKDTYCIRPETLATAKSKMTLLHPFPRVYEISPEVDTDPRAAYFRQIENGLAVRMALLAMVLGKV